MILNKAVYYKTVEKQENSSFRMNSNVRNVWLQ